MPQAFASSTSPRRACLNHPVHRELYFVGPVAPDLRVAGHHLHDDAALRRRLGNDAVLMWGVLTKHRDRGFAYEERTLPRLAVESGLSVRGVRKALAVLRRYGIEAWHGRAWERRPVGRAGDTAMVAFPRRSVLGARLIERYVHDDCEPRHVWSVPALVEMRFRTVRGRGRPKKNTGLHPPVRPGKYGSTNKAVDPLDYKLPSSAAAQHGTPGRPRPAGGNSPHHTHQPPTTRPAVIPNPTPPAQVVPVPAPTPALVVPNPPPGPTFPAGVGAGRFPEQALWSPGTAGGLSIAAGGPVGSRVRRPTGERLRAAGAPPFPKPDLATVPGAPPIPSDLSDMGMAQRVMAAYRTAMGAICPAGRWTLAKADLRRWSGFRDLVNAAKLLKHHGIAPIAWVAWRQGWWAKHNGSDVPIPVRMAFSVEAIGTQHAWWQNPCAGGERVMNPAARELITRWMLMEGEVSATPYTTDAADRAIVARHLPPGLHDRLLTLAEDSAHSDQLKLDSQSGAGWWLSQWRYHSR